MNKFRKGLLTVCLTATFLGGLTACNQPSKELQGAAGYLYEIYKDDLVNTDDYKLPATVKYNEVFYPVTWKVEVKSGNAEHVKVGTEEVNKFYTVDVVYDPVQSTEDVVYTLTATITDEKGKTITQSFEKSIPAFKFTSHAEYLAAKKDAMINVEGYIVGRYPLYNGTTQVFIQTANGEGYYVYKLPVEEAKFESDMAIGNQIIVSGKKDIYSGTAEIVSPTYQLSSKADVTVTPYDVTSLFDNASSISDATLVNLQGSLVTIKDVTLTTLNDSNGYLNFTRNGKNSYVRISSSGNCSDFDETAKDVLKGNYPSKFGYKADVTGIVNQFNGAFYLMPTSKDSIKVTGTSMEGTFAVDFAKTSLEIGTTVLSDLPTTVEGTGTTITWSSSVSGLFTADGKFTAPATPTETTLTATITSGTVSDTVVFEKVLVIKPEADTVATVEAAIAALDSGNTGVFVLEGTIVAKDSSNRPYIMDKNGDVLFIYEKMKDLEVGEQVKLYGVGTAYNGLFQLKNPKVLSESNKAGNVDRGFPTTMTPEEFQAAAEAAKTTKDLTLNGQYIRIPGLKVVKNADTGYINYQFGEGDAAKTIQSLSNHEFLVEGNVGKTVTVYGYYNGLSGNGESKFVATNVVEGIDEEPVPPVVTSKVTFDLGANAEEAKHVDGAGLAETYTLTSGSSSLVLTDIYKVYGPGAGYNGGQTAAYDAKGNSCLKLGTSKEVGTFTFTVDADVKKVIIYVAKYKANATKVTVNGTEYTIETSSNDGEYTPIEIDTTTTKTITFATVSGACRCMINTIELVK